ncbi:predicted protein [Paecilomyces variotii No. 5]|uniref:CENP-V/GFA domain-containing protein n=1 Tax=Byssochlamys spectabilis (strain No. 5 / NBRC 109023) TaxID=1356009 RepID=V5G136_BYSSN|nr:predicted protein [Paecilomyces variotii No. 5]
MPGSGSCACGNITFKYDGEPALTALCHCANCQKWTGSAFSSNVAVPTTALSIIKGIPKTWSRQGLTSGKEHLQFFCGDCGSALYSQPGGMAGTTLIKAGSLAENNISIAAELFTKDRRSYIQPIGSAAQAEKMP